MGAADLDEAVPARNERARFDMALDEAPPPKRETHPGDGVLEQKDVVEVAKAPGLTKRATRGLEPVLPRRPAAVRAGAVEQRQRALRFDRAGDDVRVRLGKGGRAHRHHRPVGGRPADRIEAEHEVGFAFGRARGRVVREPDAHGRPDPGGSHGRVPGETRRGLPRPAGLDGARRGSRPRRLRPQGPLIRRPRRAAPHELRDGRPTIKVAGRIALLSLTLCFMAVALVQAASGEERVAVDARMGSIDDSGLLRAGRPCRFRNRSFHEERKPIQGVLRPRGTKL